MRRIAVIPARVGSKRLPGKNTMKLDGKPLIEYTIDVAIESQQFDSIVVSTDCPVVLEILKQDKYEEVYVLDRPWHLTNGHATSGETVLDALSTLYFEGHRIADSWVCLLQPTSPLRTATDIQKAIQLAETENKPVYSGCIGVPNGAIYYITSDKLNIDRDFDRQTLCYEMPPSRSVDIDKNSDLLYAELLINRELINRLFNGISK